MSMRVFIVAGEASGDRHAARLMRALRELVPECSFAGIGGALMETEGLRSLVPQSHMSVVGFVEVAKRYGFFRRVLKQCADTMREWKADVFVAVDYPGFNSPLAAKARAAGIPVVWYIAPQFWAWGTGRAKKFARAVDRLLVVFPFEVEFFARFGIKAEFVGHPLLDDPDFSSATPSLGDRDDIVALLPGSRTQELQRHLPLFRQVADIIHHTQPALRCVIARSAHVRRELYDGAGGADFLSFDDNARQLMQHARVGLIKTGTSTLEAALCGLPHCMTYVTSGLSYHIARRLIHLDSIALSNILAGTTVVREFIQHEARPERIAEELLRLVGDADAAERQQQEFIAIRHLLGDSGASLRAAESIVSLLRGSSSSGVMP